jgi:hypothetical protein
VADINIPRRFVVAIHDAMTRKGGTARERDITQFLTAFVRAFMPNRRSLTCGDSMIRLSSIGAENIPAFYFAL